MKTEEMIQDLSKDLRPLQGADSLKLFLLKVLLVACAMSVVTWLLLPIRADFHLKIRGFDYYSESILWLSTALLSSLMVYSNSIPGLNKRRYSAPTILSLLVLVMVIPLGQRPHSQLIDELDLVRGICGGLITLISVFGSIFFFHWAKKYAPTDYFTTGLGISISTASLGSLLMQLICAHDTVLHIYIWHFIPTLLLAGAGAFVGKKVLRW